VNQVAMITGKYKGPVNQMAKDWSRKESMFISKLKQQHTCGIAYYYWLVGDLLGWLLFVAAAGIRPGTAKKCTLLMDCMVPIAVRETKRSFKTLARASKPCAVLWRCNPRRILRCFYTAEITC